MTGHDLPSCLLPLPARAPLFKLMEDDFKARMQAEEEAKRAAYEAEVAAAKLATVSQLVKGEVVIKPPAGSIAGRRSLGKLAGGRCATGRGAAAAPEPPAGTFHTVTQGTALPA